MDENFIYIVYALAALCGIMIAEAVYLMVSSATEKRAAINRRMVLQSKAPNQKEVLLQLRKERGIPEKAGFLPTLGGFKALRVQAGLTMPLPRFLMITTVIALGGGVVAGTYAGHTLTGLVIGLLFAPILPWMVLKWKRKRRHKMFGIQLPEALELITRGLKAGHPVPVAVSMVGREMPDPIGTEFGLVSDEITYGSDLVTALQAMNDRVGHEDLPLFITAVSIQMTTGGNLREILEGLSGTIRERGKLRRKIKAISAEGRISAYILTAVPVLFVVALSYIMPDYYNEVADESLTWYLVAGAVAWGVLGNAIMFKMASFRF